MPGKIQMLLEETRAKLREDPDFMVKGNTD